MPEQSPAEKPKEAEFSWERWLLEGVRALQRTLFRHDLGLPDEFWYHLERAAHELLTAGRILVSALRRRKSLRRRPVDEPRGPIDIEWE